MGAIPYTSLLVRARRIATDFPDIDSAYALPVLTLLVLLLNMPGMWYLGVPLVVCSAVGLAFPSTTRASAYWFAVATTLGTTVYLHWDTADNHQYLFVYWCLALCAAYTLPPIQQLPALRMASRWLIGLCMLLATAWKLATPDYTDGSFFEYTLLTDPRFAGFASATTSLNAQTLTDNRSMIGLVHNGYQQDLVVNQVRLTSSAAIACLAAFLTWWTVLIEGALAVLFLLPAWRSVSAWRNNALLIFAATTYSVAHVRGFGWILMLLGIAQCEATQKHWRLMYFAAFLLIQFYFVPLPW